VLSDAIPWRNPGGRNLLLLVACSLLVVGCAASIPREQVRRANAAYQAVAANSDRLLTDLSVAERRNFLRTVGASGGMRDG
jgi:hypothetical protein